MKVLHVYRTYFPDPPGGLQEAIRQISIATARQGIENHIFTLSSNPVPAKLDRPEASVIRSRSLASPGSCDLGGLDAFLKFAEISRQSDVIHYHFPWPFADLLHLVAGRGKPALMTYHSDIIRQRILKSLYKPLMHRMLSQMSFIVATSPTYAATSPVLTDHRYADRVRVIPLGIDEKSYPQGGDDEILMRLGLQVGEPYFLFVGVLRYYKGLNFLAEAAAKVKAKVVIAGTGPERQRLSDQANSLNVKNLIFAEQVSDKEKVTLLKNCRAVVLPSHLRSEAFGMVLIEAGMHGRPMISCEIGSGTSFVNIDGETGFVVSPESPEELASAMSSLLVNSAIAEMFGHAARLRYEEFFSEAALGTAYAKLYRNMLRYQD